MYRVFEHYLGYWGFLGNFHIREEAETFIENRKVFHPHREFNIKEA